MVHKYGGGGGGWRGVVCLNGLQMLKYFSGYKYCHLYFFPLFNTYRTRTLTMWCLGMVAVKASWASMPSIYWILWQNDFVSCRIRVFFLIFTSCLKHTVSMYTLEVVHKLNYNCAIFDRNNFTFLFSSLCDYRFNIIFVIKDEQFIELPQYKSMEKLS